MGLTLAILAIILAVLVAVAYYYGRVRNGPPPDEPFDAGMERAYAHRPE